MFLGGSARRKNEKKSARRKVHKTPFLACFFKNFPAAQKVRPKQGPFTALGELEKSFERSDVRGPP